MPTTTPFVTLSGDAQVLGAAICCGLPDPVEISDQLGSLVNPQLGVDVLEALVSLFFLIGATPAMYWLNSLGRRPLLIGSLALMALGLLIPGLWPAAHIGVIIAALLYAFFSGGPCRLS